MPTIEERLQTLEQEHTELKRSNIELQKAVELMNIALGALVNSEQDSKVAGLQTEMRQRFAEHTALFQQILARLPE